MLKKITEPQAQYFKGGAANAGLPAMPSGSSSLKNTAVKKGINKKIVSGILVATLVMVVGVAGVMTALRQQQVAGPVAPNAPASIPKASGLNCGFCAGNCVANYDPNDQVCAAVAPPPGFACQEDVANNTCVPVLTATQGMCALTFEVKAPVAQVIQVKCLQKNAVLVAADDTQTDLLPNSVVAGDSTVRYDLQVQSDGQPAGNIIIDDTLDANTTFVPETYSGYTIEKLAGNKLRITITPFPAGTKTVSYKVTVAKKSQPFTFTNSALVTDNGSGTSVPNACTVALQTAPTGAAVCNPEPDAGKTAYTLDANGNKTAIADGGSVKAGTEFYYNIKVETTGKTTGAVTVKDTLPAGVEYLTTAADTPTLKETTEGGKTVLTATLASLGDTNETLTKDIAFKVKLNADVDASTLKNTAVVTTEGSSTTSTCEHSIVVPPVGVASCDAKEMHSAALSAGKPETETRISDGSSLTENREFYYRVKLSSSKQTIGSVDIVDELPAGLEFVSSNDFSSQSGKYVANVAAFSGSKVAEMKVRVKSGVTGTITNTAVVDTNGSDSSALNCVSTFTVPSKTTVVTTVTPPITTQTVGCNATCTSNADCSNPSHICYQTSAGGRCRLDTNVTSTSCAGATTQTATQPQLPKELPQTGPEDWANWLKAGLVTLGIGAILLLLL